MSALPRCPGATVSRLRRCVVGAAVLPAAIALAACQQGPAQVSQGETGGVSGAAQGTTTTHVSPNARATMPAPHSIIRYVDGQPMPNVALTPGEAFVGVGASTFCVAGYTKRVRDVSTAMRRQVFAGYHIPYSQHGAYEVDHLIPLELGGDNGIKNLWPEKGSRPNPKDGLENRLHNLVCSGALPTAKAQHAIATNWVAALHTYGGSTVVYDQPASSTKSSSKPPSSPLTNSATAKCKDGSYSYAGHHQGTCSYHGGVAVWYR